MGVFKRGNNWYIDYYYNSKRIREVAGRTKTEATSALSARKTDIRHGKFELDKIKEKPKITIDEMAEKYLEWSKTNKRSWLRDESSLKLLRECFRNRNLIDISPFLIEGYKIKRSKEISKRNKEVSKRTVNLELACLKHLFTKAIE